MDIFEKKYNEALERARIYRDNAKAVEEYASAARYENIFPELRESEDERIRKGLIKHLKELRDWKVGTMSPIKVSSHYDAWIAYLEKQKELFKSGKGLYYYDGDKTTYCGYPATEENPYDFAMSQQEKQKPAWSEEDETAFGDLMWCIEQARKSAKDENDMGNIWFAENWVKNRLRSLRPSQKQEWSEEDERKIRQLVALLKSSKEKCMAAFYKDIDECIAWVCDLRPSWKPSEEQLNALYRAAEHFQENHFVCTPLLTLYEQLKKL